MKVVFRIWLLIWMTPYAFYASSSSYNVTILKTSKDSFFNVLYPRFIKKLHKHVKETFVPMANLSDKDKFGKNYPKEVCCRLARLCGFENVQKHTAAASETLFL
jgi:hypothetical protein